MRKLLFCIVSLFLALTATFVTSCGERVRQYRVGLSQCNNDPWRLKFNEDMRLCTFLYDNVSLDIETADGDDKRQVEQIDKMIDDGVDLLIVSPNKMKTISKAIDRAYEKGIPVVVFDRKADTENYTAYIGDDNVEIGREMGRYLASRLNGHGRVVEMQGLEESSAAMERHRGFAEIMAKYPDIKVVAECYGDWNDSTASKAMAEVLKKGIQFDAVFAHNDLMAMGAKKVVEKKGIGHIIYIGIDALPSEEGGLRLVTQGKLDASYIYPTRGYLVAQLALDILEGKPYKRQNMMKGSLVTPYNARALQLQTDEIARQRAQIYELHTKVNAYLAQYNHQRVYALLISVILIMIVVSFAVAYRLIAARRRLTEQTAEANLRFFTNVSHEFRTPLTLIDDPLERVLNDHTLSDGERLEMVRIAKRNAKVMLQMVNQILDFRKYQEGKMVMRLSRFDLSHEVSRVIEMFRFTCDRKGVELRLNADTELNVVADKQMVVRTVYNILSNALKFTPKGGHIEVTLTETRGMVTMTFKDDGRGMSKQDAAHIFERYYQAVNTKSGGTGIGLSLVKMFIDMHHGQVDVDSEIGQGTTISITLPQEQEGQLSEPEGEEELNLLSIVSDNSTDVVDNETTKEDMATDVAGQQAAQPTLLVADDSKVMLNYVAGVLGNGYHVILADDGLSAFERAVKELPDLIISDLIMPGIDGIELCRRLRRERATSHIPIILLTAQTDDNTRLRAYESGADDYMSKPFNSQVLCARVKNLLDSRRKLRSLFGVNETVDVKMGDADRQFIHDFNSCVIKNMGDSDFSLETLCGELGLSRGQLLRRVKSLTGRTPIELIRKTRLKRADQLLKAGGRSVTEVLYEVGFTSSSYFAKCYKEEFGYLPSEQGAK